MYIILQVPSGFEMCINTSSLVSHARVDLHLGGTTLYGDIRKLRLELDARARNAAYRSGRPAGPGRRRVARL